MSIAQFLSNRSVVKELKLDDQALLGHSLIKSFRVTGDSDSIPMFCAWSRRIPVSNGRSDIGFYHVGMTFQQFKNERSFSDIEELGSDLKLAIRTELNGLRVDIHVYPERVRRCLSGQFDVSATIGVPSAPRL